MELLHLPEVARVQVEALDSSACGRLLMPLVLSVIESASDPIEASDMLRLMVRRLHAFMLDDLEALLSALAGQ